MLRAREVALSLGGVPRMNTFSKLYLALLGLYPWEYVPTIPCEVLLIGKWFYVNFWDMSNWSRGMLVPLAIINHFKPTRRPKKDVTLNELYPEGIPRTRPGAGAGPGAHLAAQFFPVAGPGAQVCGMVCGARHSSLPQTRSEKAEQWMLERFEGSGRPGGDFPGDAQFAHRAQGAGLSG